MTTILRQALVAATPLLGLSLVLTACSGAPAGDEAVDSNEDELITPVIDWTKIDFRASWQKTCAPDNKYNYPSTYWVKTKTGRCADVATSQGTWDGLGQLKTGHCLYQWRPAPSNNGVIGIIFATQPSSELEAAAVVLPASKGGGPDIETTGCTPLKTDLVTFGKMTAGCGQSCQCDGCALLWDQKLYARVPTAWGTKAIGGEVKGKDGFVVFHATSRHSAITNLKTSTGVSVLGTTNGTLVDIASL